MQAGSGKIGTTTKKVIDSSVNSEIFAYISHIILSVLLGLLAGGGGILFHSLLEFMRIAFEHVGEKGPMGLQSYYIIIVPVIGALITSTMTYLAPMLAKQKGVLSVIKAIILRDGFISFKETVFHLLAPIISIGTGTPLGPEGPSAKIGSGFGSFMSQVFKLNKNDMVMYTVAGAGAAISAVFNAPIAGVFFGIEVILLNDMRNRALSALIISSVVADILSRAFLGNVKVIMIPSYSLGDISTYPFFFGLAVCCGLLSLLYFAFQDSVKHLFNNILNFKNPFFNIIIISILFGIVLIKYPQLFGIGYSTINEILTQSINITNALWLLGLKLVFIVLFIRAGAYGGTFAPALVLGAFLGFIFASSISMLFGINLDPVVFALVGMGGVLAGINSIPMTSILLVFEMTNDYKFILPLMLVSVISHLVVLYIRKGSVYSLALLDDGIDVSKRGEMDILRKIQVNTILRKDIAKVDYRMPFRDLMDVMMNSKYGDVVVVDEKNILMGIITLRDARQALMDNALVDLLIAKDLVVSVPIVLKDDPLSIAIHKIKKKKDKGFEHMENIPVVSSDKKRNFVGIITHSDINMAYERLIKEMDDIELLTGNS